MIHNKWKKLQNVKEKEKGPSRAVPGLGKTGRAANSPRATFRKVCQRFRRRECTELDLSITFCTKQTTPTLSGRWSYWKFKCTREASAGSHARDAIRPRCLRADSDEVSHTTRNVNPIIVFFLRSLIALKNRRYTYHINIPHNIHRASDQHRLNCRRANRLIVVCIVQLWNETVEGMRRSNVYIQFFSAWKFESRKLLKIINYCYIIVKIFTWIQWIRLQYNYTIITIIYIILFILIYILLILL